MAEETKARTDAIRTGLAAAGGVGAVCTLLLAVRRQRTTEEDSQQQRMTELYTVAVEQLGHDSAAVRLGALYALQRLGRTYPEQRQAIVNVWCAYLRMPFRDPEAANVREEEAAELRQELEVRLTVQELLREHVHSSPWRGRPVSAQYWDNVLSVNLAGADLYDLNLTHCLLHETTGFRRARFFGRTSFEDAGFCVPWFEGAKFLGETSFDEAIFGLGVGKLGDVPSGFGIASFEGVTFGKRISFDGAIAPLNGAHTWPEGWELRPAEDVEAPEGGDPTVPWGRLARVPDPGLEGGSGLAEDASVEPVSDRRADADSRTFCYTTEISWIHWQVCRRKGPCLSRAVRERHTTMRANLLIARGRVVPRPRQPIRDTCG
ncbi:pentapeptide repeat-containing protein [Saccharomonospora cyanea]|uniref:pentapeptide repeat-containing protein n=1 Tax=Saccharomonospora cyanea TaxID=40989 RepID=UPI0012FC2B62|nr:pentapeptide repeat-containing protein [Saccharomonospora cyanea]